MSIVSQLPCGPGSQAQSWGLVLVKGFVLVLISFKKLINISCLRLGLSQFLQPRSQADIKRCTMVNGRNSCEISIFWGMGCGYFLSQRVGTQAVSWPQAEHDGQTFPGARGAKPVPKGRELRGDQQISAGFAAISAGAGAGEASGPCPSKGGTSPSWGGEGFALKISIARDRIWPFTGKDAIFSGGRRRSHYGSTLATLSPGPAAQACPILSLCSHSQVHLCLYFSLFPLASSSASLHHQLQRAFANSGKLRRSLPLLPSQGLTLGSRRSLA